MHQEAPSEGDEFVQNLSTGTSFSHITNLHPLPRKLDRAPLPLRGEPRRNDVEEEKEVVSPEHTNAMSISSHLGTKLYN